MIDSDHLVVVAPAARVNRHEHGGQRASTPSSSREPSSDGEQGCSGEETEPGTVVAGDGGDEGSNHHSQPDQHDVVAAASAAVLPPNSSDEELGEENEEGSGSDEEEEGILEGRKVLTKRTSRRTNSRTTWQVVGTNGY